MGEEDAYHTFCGVDVRQAGPVERYHHIPECEDPECPTLVVDCPTCKAIYDVIGMHNSITDGRHP